MTIKVSNFFDGIFSKAQKRRTISWLKLYQENG